MFAAPPEQSLDWNNAGVEGANRFLKRLWKFAARHADTIDSAPGRRSARGGAPELRHEIHSVLRQVSYDYERMQYNTVVSGAMKLLNALETHAGQGSVAPAPLREGLGILLRVLYPVCPHTTWTLWNELGFATDLGPLLDAPWPQIDESALARDEIELMLQINGKLRGSIRVGADADKAHIEAAALATPEFAKFAEGRPVRKVVVVPGRLVNVVV
jgi:leucyl-tRNA synthetase